MATATPDVTEELFAIILDEHEPPCNIVPPQVGSCSRAARWAWRCPACSFDFMACDGHRTEFNREMAAWVASKPALRTISCARCGQGPVAIPFTWRPI